MFCPACHTEYRPGFTHCADCGAALTSAAPPADATKDASPDTLELAWRGTDPIVYSLLLPALEDAGIAFYEKKTSYHLMHAVALGGVVAGRPGFEIWVWQSSVAAVQAILAALVGLAASESGRSAPGYFDGDDSHADQTLFHAHVPSAWGPEEATERVWSGADLDFADEFASCLFENRIECRSQQDADGGVRVAVRPRDYARAREILRQIEQASPPR